MKNLYIMALSIISFWAIQGMDAPVKKTLVENAKLEKPMTLAEREAVKKQVKLYIRAHQHGILHKLIDLVKDHKEQTVTPPPRELSPEEIEARDKVTLAPDGSIPLTLRECIDLGITDDPRIREIAENDPFIKMTQTMEKAGASQALMKDVMEAREEEVKHSNQKSPYEAYRHIYNTWMRRFEDNSKIYEDDFNRQFEDLCLKITGGISVKNLTFDADDTFTTRVFKYKKTHDYDRERERVGNLDSKRLSDMRKMLDELKLDFNVPRQDGQLPLNVALAHGRYQAASQLILGTCGGKPCASGPVRLQLTKEEKAKNPFLLTLIDSLEESLKAYAYLTDSNGKPFVHHSVEEYLKTQYLVLAFYLLEKGADTNYSDVKEIKELPDPIDYAHKKDFDKIAWLISLARNGKLKPALELVGQDIAQTDKDLVAMGVEPYRLI